MELTVLSDPRDPRAIPDQPGRKDLPERTVLTERLVLPDLLGL